MDIIWLVLDSVGMKHTPFIEDGPQTMPKLAALASERGHIFTQAYAPGPASPSSHAAILTGELPSRNGMSEASPFFDGETKTIAETLSNTHTSYMTTVNPFLFNGLDEPFDVSLDLAKQEYLVFESGDDPRQFVKESESNSIIQRTFEFVSQSETPVRSFINGVNYKIWNTLGNDFIPQNVDGGDGSYRYASAINEKVRTFLDSPGESFVLANYMDAHPPFDVEDETLDALNIEYSRSELPIGIRAGNTGEYKEDAMYALYHASIRELDNRLYSLVSELIGSETFVIVTADHGPRFGRRNYLTDERLHVPLLIFGPDVDVGVTDKTVSLRSLPRTTALAVNGDGHGFSGTDLLSVEEHNVAETEYIHRSDGNVGPVNPHGGKQNAQYDLKLYHGDAKLRLEDGTEVAAEGSEDDLSLLRERATELHQESFRVSTEKIEYEKETEGRLEDLGYL